MKRYGKGVPAALALGLLAGATQAGDVEIRRAVFDQSGTAWRVSVTLEHGDTGWDHYADGWRVVDAQGQVFGHRTLYHPHVNEQPFTRSHTMGIPAEVGTVYVEAHDTVHGWSPQRLKVELGEAEGPGFAVRRR